MPEITEVSFSGSNVPFSMNTANGSINYKGHAGVMTNFYDDRSRLSQVLDIKMKDGRWYNKADAGSKIQGVVITRKLEEQLFEGQPGVGKEIGDEQSKMKVIGVHEDNKRQRFLPGHRGRAYISPLTPHGPAPYY
jgi:putative ABC transport system permease protein